MFVAISILSAIFVTLFVYFTVSIYMMRKKYAHIPGPKTNGLLGFYMGNLDQVLVMLKNDQILADLIGKWRQEYGPVFKFQVFNKTAVFTTDPDAIKEILIKRNFTKIRKVYTNAGFPFNERFLGKGLITEQENDKWRERRALFNPAFARSAVNGFLGEFNQKTDLFIQRLRTLADGKTKVVLLDELNNLALDIIASVAFNLQVDNINNPNGDFKNLVFQSLKGLYISTFDPLLQYKPQKWLFIHQYKQVVKKLRKIGRDQIMLRFSSIKDNDYVPDDLLTSLIKSHGNGTIDVEDFVDDFVTYFVAGQETTANTLAFVFLELGKNKAILEKLRAELDETIGSKSMLDQDDLAKLSYTNCVYKETLRLWPPIPEIGREIDADDEKPFDINGYRIPPGTWLQVSSYMCARDAESFPEPLKFKPERFSRESEDIIQNYTYFPFSLGPRSCIGQNFAQMLGKMIIAKFVANFDFELIPTQNMGVRQEATLRPADGTQCYITPRK